MPVWHRALTYLLIARHHATQGHSPHSIERLGRWAATHLSIVHLALGQASVLSRRRSCPATTDHQRQHWQRYKLLAQVMHPTMCPAQLWLIEESRGHVCWCAQALRHRHACGPDPAHNHCNSGRECAARGSRSMGHLFCGAWGCYKNTERCVRFESVPYERTHLAARPCPHKSSCSRNPTPEPVARASKRSSRAPSRS